MHHPRRVLVLNERDPLHPAAGGAEVHVAEVARRLAGLGFEVTQAACSFRGAPEREELPGLLVWRLGPLGVYYPRAAWATARETRAGRFDVVVEHLHEAAVRNEGDDLAVGGGHVDRPDARRGQQRRVAAQDLELALDAGRPKPHRLAAEHGAVGGDDFDEEVGHGPWRNGMLGANRLAASSWQLSAISYQLSATSYQLSAISVWD